MADMILVSHCGNNNEFLMRYRGDIGGMFLRQRFKTDEILSGYGGYDREIRDRYWGDTGEILVRYCGDTGEILLRYW